MTQYRRLIKPSHYLRTLVALKLREIEHEFETYEQFVAATGLATSMVFKLLRGSQNVTSDALETLAANLRIPLWELLNAPAYTRNGLVVENTTVDHEQIKRALRQDPSVKLDSLKGGKRRDWIEEKVMRAELRRQKLRRARLEARAEKAGGATKSSAKRKMKA